MTPEVQYHTYGKPASRLVRLRNRLRHRFFDNFFYIHIPKCAGSSIVVALDMPRSHDTAQMKIEKFGRSEWDKRTTFSIVRNPWDKVVSYYRDSVARDRNQLATRNIDFPEWVSLVYRDKNPDYYDDPKQFQAQTDWLSDSEGNLLVDFVGRYESLQADFLHICDMIGKSASLPHINASKRGHYREYYDDESKAIVAEWHARDLENFGYEF